MAIFPGSAIPSAVSDYEIDNSLRFNVSEGYLRRTFASAGNQQSWTWSSWVKRSTFDSDQFYLFATDYSDTANYMHLNLRASHATEAKNYTGQIVWIVSSTTRVLRTTQKFRDCGAWMHICIVCDTPDAVAANRLRLYVNGEEVTAWDTDDRSGIGQNDDLPINRAGVHDIGGWNGSGSTSGYLAEAYFIDGTALEPDSFGELDSTTNQWIPLDSDDVKDAVTFGTNGFYQKYNSTELATSFDDSSSSDHTITATGDVKNVRGANLDTTYSVIDAFTSTGADTWTCPAGVTSIELLSVAGGGGGAYRYYGGGGGAGGIIHDTSYTVVPGVVYDLSVGAGGAAGAAAGEGADGSDTVWNVNAEGSGITFTADGGGGGSGTGNGNPGGSGGGAKGSEGSSYTGGAATQASPTGATGYGYAGGNEIDWGGAGGGGSSEVGGSPDTPTGKGGDGGDGRLFSTFVAYGTDSSNVASTGSNGGYFGGGGGGGAYPDSASAIGGVGGIGGGGKGAKDEGGASNAVAGTANTGGGGGAGAWGGGGTANGKAGGSGILLISYELTKPGSSSIKFDGTGDYLTPGSSSDWAFGTGDFTVETWINQGSSPETYEGIFGTRGGVSDTAGFVFGIKSDGAIYCYSNAMIPTSATGVISANTWHHVALVRDSGDFEIFVDGVSVATDSTARTFTTTASRIGATAYDASETFIGYMDEFRVSNSARYTAAFTPQTTQFTADGNTKLLIHSDYTGGLGADSSGNYNTFTPTNLVATDQVPDSPTNNFCTMNPLWRNHSGGTATFSEGNLKNYNQYGDVYWPATQELQTTGKWYFECYADANSIACGIRMQDNSAGATNPTIAAGDKAYLYMASGVEYPKGTVVNGTGYTSGDILGFAVNLDDGEIKFYKNNVLIYTGTNMNTLGYDYLLPVFWHTDGSTVWVNFGADSSFAGTKTGSAAAQDANSKGDFYYEPLSGHLALCTDNLSDPEIALPGDYFNTVKYAGNSSTNVITTGMAPDFVWLKSTTTTYYNQLYDSVRGVNLALYSNETDAQFTDDDALMSFDSTGFTLGAEDGANNGSNSYVSWDWKAGGAPTADNSAGAGATPTAGSVKIDGSNLGSALAGTIAATRLSASTTAGFSIVVYEGTEAVATVAHGLSQAPELILFKNIDSALFWPVYSKPTDATDYLKLNDTNARADSDGYFNDTEPTSTVFSLGDKTNLNRDTCIAYCFHSIEGYSKVGSYVGNGNADGTFVYTGFRPSYILYKLYDGEAGQNWVIEDAARNPYNYLNKTLLPNSNAAEADSTSTVAGIDFVSNGIKFRGTDNGMNYSGYDYIYMAFAESPFKTSNAR